MTKLLIAIVLVCAASLTKSEISLEKASTIYFPFEYLMNNPDDPIYAIDSGAVEATAYDPEEGLAYVAGVNFVHIVDLSTNESDPTIFRKSLDYGASDISVCGDLVAVVLEGDSAIERGHVYLYKKFRRGNTTWSSVFDHKVGYGPDQLAFNNNCSVLIVSNEGEAEGSDDDTQFVNPEGSVTIIRIIGDDLNDFTISRADFKNFNRRADEYVKAGVRWPYKGELQEGSGTFSRNLEPGSVTFNEDGSLAFVSLQENNAIAVLDVAAGAFTEIYALGTKSWKGSQLDVSDMDGGIIFDSYDIESFRQPDMIRYITIGGEGYIITANEGDMFDYLFVEETWREFRHGKEIIDGGMWSPDMDVALKADMEADDRLGRLYFSVVDGLDDEGKVVSPKFYGGRGISIFRASDFKLVYDSDDLTGTEIAERFPKIFNAISKSRDPSSEGPANLFDFGSHATGSECESLALGMINGTQYLFVGIDGASAVGVFKFEGNSTTPTLETIYRDEYENVDGIFADLYKNRTLGDLTPEGLIFVPAKGNTPPRLLVSGKVSGTLSVYNIIGSGFAPLFNLITMVVMIACSVTFARSLSS